MRKWTSQTEDGPGDAENYAYFETRSPETISRHHNANGPMLALMFMSDKYKVHPMSGKLAFIFNLNYNFFLHLGSA